MSLSLSVAYQKMRYSNVPMYRTRGKQAFQKNTQLLGSLGDTFWTAKVMAAMAEQVLQEMNKAVASLAGGHEPHQPADASTRRMVDLPPGGHDASGALVSHIPTAQPRADPLFSDMDVPDLDVFGHFDPTFDLGAVDAALEGNLDFGASSNWFDWQALWG